MDEVGFEFRFRSYATYTTRNKKKKKTIIIIKINFDVKKEKSNKHVNRILINYPLKKILEVLYGCLEFSVESLYLFNKITLYIILYIMPFILKMHLGVNLRMCKVK